MATNRAARAIDQGMDAGYATAAAAEEAALPLARKVADCMREGSDLAAARLVADLDASTRKQVLHTAMRILKGLVQ